MISKNTVFYLIIGIAIVAVAYFALSWGFGGGSAVSIRIGLYSTNASNLYPFNTTTFMIQMNNTGTMRISNMLIGLYLNGNPVRTYNISLPAGQGARVILNYSYQHNGTYDFEAIADPAHVFDIKNRNETRQSLLINVSKAAPPSPFSSIPNGNITESRSFVFLGEGLPIMSALAGMYNITPLRTIFGNNLVLTNALQTMTKDSYGEVNSTYGAAAQYSDGSYAQSIWIQGPLTPHFLETIAGSFGFAQTVLPNNRGSMFATGNGTSMCVSFLNGWTRIVSYESKTGNCGDVTAAAYAPSQAQRMDSVLGNYSMFVNYRTEFMYNGSVGIGDEFGISNSSVFLVNSYQNAHGIFFGYINRSVSSPRSVNSNDLVCYGLLSKDTRVCSVYLAPLGSQAANYSAVESKQVTPNYTIALFSVVNNTERIDAHYNGAILINRLNLSGEAYPWVSPLKNTCMLNSSAIRCGIEGFNSSSNMATLNFTNNLNSTMTLNYGYCYISGTPLKQWLNKTLSAGETGSFAFACTKLPIPIVGFVNSYGIYINYTVDNGYRALIGSLNISEIG